MLMIDLFLQIIIRGHSEIIPIFLRKNQSHIYNQAGTFNVKLYVENNFGCKDSLSKSNNSS